MPDLVTPYLHIQNALAATDVEFLRCACKRYILQESIPCYVLINNRDSPTYLKVKEVLEQRIGEPLYYLNDFYIYTDSSFKTGWHMDTELFALDRAVNAWILLSPDHVEDPLGFINQINDSPEHYYHSVRMEQDQCIFGNYCTGNMTVRSLATIEKEQIHTPRIEVGDILLLNPKRFHKTNISIPKHAIALKFVMKGQNGFLSQNQVDPHFWPEVALFNKLVKGARNWEDVVDGIRHALTTEAGRKELSAGFYPEKFKLYERMVASL